MALKRAGQSGARSQQPARTGGLATSRSEVLPNLLVIGTQKSGTTWLHALLAGHPQIFMSTPKELEFFTGARTKTMDDYLAHFEAGAGRAYRGESTPGYFKSPHKETRAVAELAWETLGADTKLVIVYRNPVDRAVSAYLHHWRQGRLRGDEPILEAGHCIVETGFYSRHTADWLAIFPRRNFFFCTTEQLMRPRKVARKLARWLGIEPFGEPPDPRHVGSHLVAGEAGLSISDLSLRRVERKLGRSDLTRPVFAYDELAALESRYDGEADFVSAMCGFEVDWPARRCAADYAISRPAR